MFKAVIIYDNDLDGFTSKSLLKRKLNYKEIEEHVYIRDSFSPSQIDFNPDTHVFILDLCLPVDDLMYINSVSDSVTVIDHHRSTLSTLIETISNIKKMNQENRIKKIYSELESTTQLVYENYFDYFEHAPTIYKVINDVDLGKASEEYQLIALALRNKTITEEDLLSYEKIVCFDDIIEKGKVIKREFDKDVEKALENACYAFIEDELFMCVNAPFKLTYSIFEKVKHEDNLCVYSVNAQSRFIYSLRSNKVDVSEIAKKHGGGGHKCAAGFWSHEFILDFENKS